MLKDQKRVKRAGAAQLRAEKYTLETAAAQEFLLRQKPRTARDLRVIVTEGQPPVLMRKSLQISDRRTSVTSRFFENIYFGVTAFRAGAMIGAVVRAGLTVSTGAGCTQLRILCRNGFTVSSPSATRSALRSKSS